MSRHSNTLRQACLAGTEAQAMTGGSSASDLSDIVVLSTSPSQEATRLEEQQEHKGNITLAEILRNMWSRGNLSREDATEGGREEEEETQQEEITEEKNCMKNGPRGKNVKILFKHSEEKPLVHQASKAKKDTEKKCELQETEDSHDLKELPPMSNILAANQWNGDSLLRALRILEIDSASEEDEEDKETLKVKEANLKDAAKTDCTKLITEIPETEKISLLPTTHREKAKFKTTEGAPYARPVRSSSMEMRPDTTTVASTKKTAKKEKKKKQKLEKEKGKDQSEDNEFRERKLPYMIIESPELQSEISHLCYEDETLSGWPVNESDHALDINKCLAIDELSAVSTKTLKEEMKSARRQERSKVKTGKERSSRILEIATDDGELYETCLPSKLGTGVKANREEFLSKDLKSKRVKKGKHTKKQKNKEECHKEDPNTSQANEVPKCTVDMSAKKVQPEPLAIELLSEDSKKIKCDLAEKEIGGTNRKARHIGKVKAAKKARRGSSRKRASQLSCDFQYLFSVDVKVGEVLFVQCGC